MLAGLAAGSAGLNSSGFFLSTPRADNQPRLIQHFKRIRLRIRIQGFHEKNVKKIQLKFFSFLFMIKNCNLLVARPQKRTLKKMKCINFILFFVVHFCPPESRSGFSNPNPWIPLNLNPIRIQIQYTGLIIVPNLAHTFWFWCGPAVLKSRVTNLNQDHTPCASKKKLRLEKFQKVHRIN
jgi:hypothetical protein